MRNGGLYLLFPRHKRPIISTKMVFARPKMQILGIHIVPILQIIGIRLTILREVQAIKKKSGLVYDKKGQVWIQNSFIS